MTEKHLNISGSSKISWKDAIVKTIEEASETLEHITSIKILEQKAHIKGNKIIEYLVNIDLSFIIDKERRL